LKMKDQMGLAPELTQYQVSLIKEIEGLKANTKTFKDFEHAIMKTEWFMRRNYRGF